MKTTPVPTRVTGNCFTFFTYTCKSHISASAEFKYTVIKAAQNTGCVELSLTKLLLAVIKGKIWC